MADKSDPRQGWEWTRLKALVVARARGICALCGEPGATTADHVIPLSKGGAHVLANLQAAHGLCNRRKSDSVGPLGAPSRHW